MTQTYLSDEDYTGTLEELGGEATTREIADELGRDTSVVRRRMKSAEGVECRKVGNHYLHRLEDARADDEGAQEDDDE